MRRGCSLALALLMINSPGWGHDIKGPGTIRDYSLQQVSPHVYVVHGPQQLPSPATEGFLNNPAVIETRDGLVVVDPGSSVQIGRELLTKLARLSDKPVIAVFNTHVHGDHWLGNQAIVERFPAAPIYAHKRMIEHASAGAGDRWLGILSDMTKGKVDGTRPVTPTRGLAGGEELSLGGITLRIHHTGRAHTDHDIMIEVVDDALLFCGDIVASKRVPNSDVPQDASFRGTQAAIEKILAMPLKLFIPGHGRSGGREVPAESLRFLEILNTSVAKYYKQGMADYEMKDRVAGDLAGFRDWHNFNELGRVISFVYQEVEQENF